MAMSARQSHHRLHDVAQPLSCHWFVACGLRRHRPAQPKVHFSGRRPLYRQPLLLQDNHPILKPSPRLRQAITLLDAARQSPALARLVDTVHASSQRLERIRPLLPPPLRTAIQAGPLEEGQWCLLAQSNAVAAKLRQMLPLLKNHLDAAGLPVSGIRIKVLARQS